MIKIYSKPGCSYCVKAKLLLEQNSIAFTEVVLDVGQVHELDKEYLLVADFKTKYPLVKTLPYVLLDEAPIGGFGTYTSLVNHLS